MVSRCSHVVLGSLLIAVVAATGCAKRPATTQASAPAPAGAAGTTAGGTGAAPARSSEFTGPGSTGSTSGSQSSGSTATPSGATAGAARPSPREFSEVAELRDIHFDFDKYDIRAGDARVLDSNATWLKSNPNHLLLIEGHCDERGTNEYNLALGERRAKSTMNYLVAQGVQASRITIISYGKERPVCTERNESCWMKNRRSHFLTKAQ